MNIELLAIPIITTVLTTGILYFKEWNQSNDKIKRKINEQKLTELYNDLFSMSLIYTDKLEQSFYEGPKGEQIEVEGDLDPNEDTLMIINSEFWDDVIIKIRETIHKKIHLLEQDDLRQWHKIELMELEEKMTKTYNVYKYKELGVFLVNISIIYFKFYNEFHFKKASH
jgi:hypothetical protein